MWVFLVPEPDSLKQQEDSSSTGHCAVRTGGEAEGQEQPDELLPGFSEHHRFSSDCGREEGSLLYSSVFSWLSDEK